MFSRSRFIQATAVLALVLVAGKHTCAAPADSEGQAKQLDLSSFQRLAGFFDLYWDDSDGKLWLDTAGTDSPFLYVSSLASGLGSNPVGLDRGQFGSTRIVRFRRVGKRYFLIQENTKYRASSRNPAERNAVSESFAPSILFSATAVAASDDRSVIDITSFLIRDAHDCIGALARAGEGAYQLASQLSYVHMPRTKVFPDNVEMEATLTFTSKKAGSEAQQVAADGTSVTLRQHHSFVRLPDDGFRPREWHPRSGTFSVDYADYSAAIDQPSERRLITRHRLEKKDPGAARGPAVEPIVYYVDSGAPQPIRDALLDGARWWNEAFSQAGYIDAFRVEVLPEGVDPMDIRYNVIQWVHRATRGWSYGQSIVDPRTGEIIKGHVLLGSLRVRQDRLLFDGLSPEQTTSGQLDPTRCLAAAAPGIEMAAQAESVDSTALALARIRQLSAHEVGHTLGFAHNFAASTYGDRASVMDYPAPRIKAVDGQLDFSDAYGVGIGQWDRFAVRYAYEQFPEATERKRLQQLLDEADEKQLLYLTDRDARPAGAAHPLANLWDNGRNPVVGLRDAIAVRQLAIEQFKPTMLASNEPLANVEQAFVPVYLHHRYQIEAAIKLIGGYSYSYSVGADLKSGRVKPDSGAVEEITASNQVRALSLLLSCLAPDQLVIPDRIVRLMPPRPSSSATDRERFSSRTSPVFDTSSAVQAVADMVLSGLLHPERASRLASSNESDWSLGVVLGLIADAVFTAPESNTADAQAQQVVMDSYVQHLLRLARRENTPVQVQAVVREHLGEVVKKLDRGTNYRGTHAAVCKHLLAQVNAALETAPLPRTSTESVSPPPGSPIGN
ncbi:MAG: zinc-dependent metalloprotease [Aureliella sp.]